VLGALTWRTKVDILPDMSQTQKILSLIQLGVGVLLVIAILSQSKGVGLSNVFGGSDAVYRTKRGLEKWLFYSTIAMAIAFIALSIAVVLVSKI
jgi:preprotein translocase subunit SecG